MRSLGTNKTVKCTQIGKRNCLLKTSNDLIKSGMKPVSLTDSLSNSCGDQSRRWAILSSETL